FPAVLRPVRLSSASLDPSPTAPALLSLHDALPIWPRRRGRLRLGGRPAGVERPGPAAGAGGDRRRLRGRRRARSDGGGGGPVPQDRKSTRLNSSHVKISYAVFCLKKKKKNVVG